MLQGFKIINNIKIRQMLNVEKLSERYQGQLGDIQWGAKQWYVIESDEPVMLNRTRAKFITNDEGLAEEFRWIGDDSLETSKKTYRLPLSAYYPHPWYPNKEIVSFEIVRLLPGHDIGDYIEIFANCLISNSLTLTVQECLQMPEFFMPVYK